jgi:hypothetical protein
VAQERQPTDLVQLLDRIEGGATDREQISLDHILDAIGRRSFGPFLLLAGLVTVVPVLGDVPGVPTLMGLLVLLTGAQLLLQRDHFWLPGWLLRRSVSRGSLCRAIGWMRRPARVVDRWSRPRLTTFTQGAGTYVIAVACLVIAAGMPAMELVPFSANGAGAALLAFGLALIGQDGVIALLALAITVGTFAAVGFGLL